MQVSCDIFVSYAREERWIAERLVEEFGRSGWTVFFDRDIAAGSNWNDILNRQLVNAKCVVVLWTQLSIGSDFVKHEASIAMHRERLVQVVINESQVPAPYVGEQSINIDAQSSQLDRKGVKLLLKSIGVRVGPPPPVLTLPTARDYQEVSAEHLALVHSAWRRPDKGPKMYQIHIILVGQPDVLNRVDNVTYYLDPVYPTSTYEGTDRKRNFGIYELANGYSVVRAKVKIKEQAALVELSRFVNLSETGPRLAAFFDQQ
jgi:hypothetical protein